MSYNLGKILSLLLPFFLSLCLAWYFNWCSKDLIWSLWLSSLIVGLLIIMWGVICTFFRKSIPIAKELKKESPVKKLLFVLGALFLLTAIALYSTFIVFHFSAFHFGHAVFLNFFFPIFDMETIPFPPDLSELKNFYWPIYGEYMTFIPVAIWAQRDAFRFSSGFNPIGPYKNVVKMHLLIFFFAFAFAMKLENFVVYAIVYAFFFFPWEVFRKNK